MARILSLIFSALLSYLFSYESREDKKKKEYHKYFKYIWNLEELAESCNNIKSNEKEKFHEILHEAYINACYRINRIREAEKKQISLLLQEVEHNFKRKRSLEQLCKQTWRFAEQFAVISGYQHKDVKETNFDCIGWKSLWEFYWYHKDRIIKKENSKFSNDDNYNQKSEKIGPKEYYKIFENINDISALDEKYFSLRKKNSDNHEALNILERLYNEAKEKIINEKSNRYEKSNNTENSKDYSEPFTKNKTTKEKNEALFKDIHTLEELKQKYYRLAKRNHPDSGGNEAAMKKLNELFQEAKQRILSA